jgi:hypothetical protein
MMTQGGVAMVEFTVGDQQALFSLGGFADLQEALQQRCGYEFSLGAASPLSRPGRR